MLAQFESWDGYRKFALSVQRKARHVFEDHVYKFLETVIATSEKRKRELPIDRFLWRAQQGDHWEEVSVEGETFPDQQPLPPNRMKPLPHSAREGRVNPKGIPCLYLATDKDTAMAEIRPWIGSYISVGQFKTLRNLNLVDCSVEHARGFTFYRTEPDPAKREEAVWAEIDSSFSEPINSDESNAEYAPTQILAEAFRKNGYDGVMYKSHLGKGFNVAIFDINAAELVNCCLFRAESLEFKFEQAGNPYIMDRPSRNQGD